METDENTASENDFNLNDNEVLEDNEVNNNEDKQDESLPDTGEVKQNSGLASGILAGLGGLLLLNSRRRNKNDDQTS
ncbi:LPXTG cell wall anchor domain-containing protein [Mammaliicoccus sciuri]